VAGAPRTPPDDQFETGGGHSTRVLRWHCVDGQRVLMHRSCGEGMCLSPCGDWKIEKHPCGSPETELERTYDIEGLPIPDGEGWR
jgi:hypothetical protein